MRTLCGRTRATSGLKLEVPQRDTFTSCCGSLLRGKIFELIKGTFGTSSK